MNEMNEYTNEEIAAMVAARDEAEANGLYDTIENPQALKMTPEQEAELARAMYSLYSLASETNSSLSELIKYAK